MMAIVDSNAPSGPRTHVRGRSLPVALLVAAMSLAPAIPAGAAFPGGNGAIAFARNGHVWTVQPDGTQTKLAAGREPAWSPDGSRIAYVHNTRYGIPNIWTMAADGSDRTQLTSGSNYRAQPAWSPDGARLVFVLGRASDHDLATIDAATPFDDPVFVTDTPSADEAHPEWSPDGTRIAFDVLACPSGKPCSFRIGVVAPDGGNYTRLTPATGDEEIEPDWSPDSSTLLFGSDRDGAGSFDFDVYSIPASGGTVTRVLTAPAGAINLSPVWSPDGTRFADVHRSAGSRVSIRTASADGTSSVRVCRAFAGWDSVGPDWQPT
jgi:Tol biopolymer transport system component